MYHIKPDKRVLSSVAAITAGLKTCLATKTFEQITITDIQRASSVGRATFYRIFDSTVDVLAYQCDRLFIHLLPTINQVPRTDAQVLALIEQLMVYDDFFELILASHHLEVLYAAHQNRISTLLREAEFPDALDQYALGVGSSIMMGALTTWLARGKRETAPELLDLIKRTLKMVTAYGTASDTN